MPAVRRRQTVFLTTLVLVALVGPLFALVAGLPAFRGGADRPSVGDLLDRIPLGFEPNQGQYHSNVRFVARAPGHTVLLTSKGLAVSTPAGRGSTVGIVLEGARPDAEIVTGEAMPGQSNQFLGDDPSRWRSQVETYGTVSYRGAYPGIDVVFYGQGRYVEHDFVVAPGADPSAIRLALSGDSGSHLDRNGDLVLPNGGDEVRLRAPTLYQDVDGRRQPVEGRYQRLEGGRIGFQVGPYDRTRPLVIDPVVVSASYLGGTSTETAYGVAADADGNIVVTGYTESSDFPTLSPTQANLVQSEGARTDVFVTKVKADGTTVLWSTYLGGRGRDAALAVAVGGDGAVYVTGYTESSDFPTNRPLQNANAGGANDVFVAKLNSAGSALEYSTYLGGKGAETASGIAVDGSGSAYVVGHTGSADFPTARPFQTSLARPDDLDGFVTKIQPGGGGLAYSSYLGGGGDDHLTDVAVDGEGGAHVVGDTRAGDFPTVRGFQPTLGGAAGGGNFADGVVAKIKPDGSGLVYGSFLGGTDSDKATAVALDSQGNAYVSGNTGSANFPVVSAFQPKKDGDFDAFVTKLKSDGNLAYSSFLGGSGSDGGEAVAVNRQGRAFVTGATASTNFPTVKPFQGEKKGGFVDAFVTEVSANGQSLVSSSYLGGREDDQSAGLVVDTDGNLVIVGYTNSIDFPIAKPFQPQKAGGVGDAFVVKVQSDATAEGASTPAASKRDRRVRTLVTITGGLLIAAALQTLWLRRRPEPREEPERAPTGEELEVPGLRYVPRRGRAAPGRTQSGGFAPSEPIKGADWDKRRPARLGPEDELEDDEWESARPKRRKPRPAWDEAQRPVLRSIEGPGDVPVGNLGVPDLWGSDAPLAEAAASVRAGRNGGRTDRDEPDEALADPDQWPAEPVSGPPLVAELDPMDVWGPLVVEQDPEEWADDWGITGLLKTGELQPPDDPEARARAERAAREEAERAERAALAEREAAEAAAKAAEAERAALEAAAQEAAARVAAEQAEREAAELAAQDAADVWGPQVVEAVKAAAALTEAAPSELEETAAARAAVAPTERAAVEPTEREAREAAEREAREAAERERAERERAERERAERERAERERAERERTEREAREAAERAAREEAEREQSEREARERAEAEAQRAALHAAVQEAAEREAQALRAAAQRRPEPAGSGLLPGQEREAAEQAAMQAAELEAIAERRAEAARTAQEARLTAQAEAAEASRKAEAAQAEARAAAQAAALQAALAAFEAAEAEAARIAEADTARLAAQVAAQVAEAHASRIAAHAAAAAEAEADARARAEAQLEAERQAAEAAEAAARAQAEADARAAAAAAAAAEAELQAEASHEPSEGGPGSRPAWAEALARAEAWATEAKAAEIAAAEAAAAAELAELTELEAAEAAELAELEAEEAREAEARAAERQARLLRSPEERAAEREAAEARAAEARAAEARAAEARAAQVRAAEARADEARAAQARAAEARAAQARAAEAQAAEARAAEARGAEARAAEARAAEARAADARAAKEQAAKARAGETRAAPTRAGETRGAPTRAAEARPAGIRGAEARAPQARAAQPPVPQPPPQAPAPSPAPPRRDLSLSELLDEDLPIPDVGREQRERRERDRQWLDQVLDEEYAPSPASAPPAGRQPVAPPPNPSGLVGGTTGDEEEPDDFLPPPPPRLLTNLFEPDPDDPLVQSTQSHRGKRRKDP